MGKYGKTQFVPNHLEGSDVGNAILLSIANELAEANRLKRLELTNSHTYTDMNMKKQFQKGYTKEELEDLA